MPILSEETAIFPDILLDGFIDTDRDRCWWVMQTKPRQEKSLAREFSRYEIPFYLPLVSKRRRVRGRKIRSYIPLFSGYVFVYSTADERTRSKWTQRVAHVLAVENQQQLYADLRQVQQLIEADVPLTVEARLVPGQRVRIRYGAMAGLEGTILTRRRQTRLVVAVEFLLQGASVELDDCLLEPCD